MSDRQYVLSGSGMVHVFRTWTRGPGMVRTLCGRSLRNRATIDLSDRIPSDRPFCENCGRITAARTDQEQPADTGEQWAEGPVP